MTFNIPLKRGDGYVVNVTVTVPDTDPAEPVDCTGAVAVLGIKQNASEEPLRLRLVGEIVDGPAGQLRFTFSPLQTAALQAGAYLFDIQVTKPGGVVDTPFDGFVIVSEDITQELPPLSDISLSKATARFVGPDGVPVRQRVIVGMPLVAKSGNYGVVGGTSRVYEADVTGSLEIPLVRGTTVRVALEGTSFVREFVVPDSDFDLLSVMASAPDPFTVQAQAPFLTRRSL
jgi:hypothetical protein